MRMRVIYRTAAAIGASLLVSGTSWAVSVGDKVDNFRLRDHQGGSHELYYFSDMQGVLLLTYGTECQKAAESTVAVQALRDQYKARGIQVLLIDSNLNDSQEEILAATKQANINLPVLLDETQLIGESLAVKKNGEALLINPKDWKLAYRGSVQAAAPAIDALLAGQTVSKKKTRVSGCSIEMPEAKRHRKHAKISYEQTIAPMLRDNCALACHRQGGVGPWQMTSYDMVKGFGPMIREVVRTQRMPPWHADPHYGVFSNNRSLTTDEAKTLVHWIEAGAPRGKGGDPLVNVKPKESVWALGTPPDLVLEVPAYNVPATGEIPYQFPVVENPLDHDVWVRAIDVVPGEATVVHHVLAGNGADLNTARRAANGGTIGAYVPGGANPYIVADEAGILLRKGEKIVLQFHYTANGKAATDRTRIGLYFRKDPPKYESRVLVLAKPTLKIPANTKAHTESQEMVMRDDILVYSLTAHAHVRGTASKYVAIYPDGRQETLLNVPRYDFNWQTTYEFEKPKVLPKGTKVVFSQTWDNSVLNKSNPDPNRVVPWGEQTWDEMLYGVIRYRSLNTTVAEQKTAQNP